MALATFFTFLIIFLISTLPLYFAVKILGGKTGLLKTFLVVFISGIILTIINLIFPVWGWLIGFLFLLWFYRELFRLKWWKAFVAWILQFVFLVLLLALAAILTGVSVLFA